MWADNLIAEYEEGRKELGKKANNLSNEGMEKYDKAMLNSMIRDMTFCLDWLRLGREPGSLQGIDKRSAYQKEAYFEDMDLFPTLELKPKEELTDDKKRAVLDVLMTLSGRQRQCYILHNGYMMTMKEIGEEINIKVSTVQYHLENAEKKIKKHIAP